MQEHRETLQKRLQELEQALQSPEVLQNHRKLQEVSREYNRLREILNLMDRLDQARADLALYREMLAEAADEAERAEIQQEMDHLEQEIPRLETELRRRLLPENPEDRGNAILEIRAGTGGEEAALFARDLLKMYLKYAEKKGWKTSITELHETELGGVREAVVLIEGPGAYGHLKYESGVHRVQRVPVTESGGRIHTSSASVVVMPESEEETDIEIKPDEIRIETFRASGPGGQHVNVTDSAVRVIHLPTGIVVSVQDERSQHKNRAKALRILKARLLDRKREEERRRTAALRRTYIGTGDRSEKIRTYNFPQNRVTDHRIGFTLYALESVLEGNLDPVIEALREHEEARRLEELQKSGSAS